MRERKEKQKNLIGEEEMPLPLKKVLKNNSLMLNLDNINILVPMDSSHQLVEDQLVDMFVAKLVLLLMVSHNLNQLLPTNTSITTHHLLSTMLETCSLGALGHQENKLLLLLPLLNNNSAILVNVERKMPRV